MSLTSLIRSILVMGDHMSDFFVMKISSNLDIFLLQTTTSRLKAAIARYPQNLPRFEFASGLRSEYSNLPFRSVLAGPGGNSHERRIRKTPSLQ